VSHLRRNGYARPAFCRVYAVAGCAYPASLLGSLVIHAESGTPGAFPPSRPHVRKCGAETGTQLAAVGPQKRVRWVFQETCRGTCRAAGIRIPSAETGTVRKWRPLGFTPLVGGSFRRRRCIRGQCCPYIMAPDPASRRIGYARTNAKAHQPRRNRYAFAFPIPPCGYPQKRVRRRIGYAPSKNSVQALCRRIGYGIGPPGVRISQSQRSGQERARQKRTRFCVDKRPYSGHKTRSGGAASAGAQKRVRFLSIPLWKTLWDQQVIPAESGSLFTLKRVRPVADSGSALRRNRYKSAQNRVRRGM